MVNTLIAFATAGTALSPLSQSQRQLFLLLVHVLLNCLLDFLFLFESYVNILFFLASFFFLLVLIIQIN